MFFALSMINSISSLLPVIMAGTSAVTEVINLQPKLPCALSEDSSCAGLNFADSNPSF